MCIRDRLTPESFDSVKPGDVLVTRTTNPSWAPLFGTIGALVADSGGVLSHGAIVARELSLPAVMGTKLGTSVIKQVISSQSTAILVQ